MAVLAEFKGIQAYLQLKKVRREIYHIPEHTETVEATDELGIPLIDPDGHPVMETRTIPHKQYKRGAACVYVYTNQEYAYNNDPLAYYGSIEFDYDDTSPIDTQAYNSLIAHLGDNYIDNI